MPVGPAAGRRVALVLAIVAIVLAGSALRVIGIGFGDPFVYHPDEWILARPAMAMAATGDWNPHNFAYPSLLTDLEALLVAVLRAAGGPSLATGQPWLYQNELLPDQFGYVLAGRLIVALFGAATILVVFETARRLAGPAGGLAAAAIVAVVPLAVENAHYLTTDVPMTLLCALCLLSTVIATQGGSRRWWLAAALFAGLAGSTKWNGFAVAAVPLVVYVASRIDPARPVAPIRDPIPFAMVAATLVGFVAPTPAIVLAPAEVASWLSSSAAIYAVPDPRQTQDSITFNLRTLIETLGPLIAWSVAGIVVVVARFRGDPHARAALTIPMFIVGYFFLASIPARHYARNLLPILPFLAVAGGIAAATLLDRFRARTSSAVVALALVASLAPSAMASIAVATGLTRLDTRDVARTWMLAHVPRATTVAREIYTPQFDEREFAAAGSFFLHEVGLDRYRSRGVRYIIASSWAYERFVGKSGTPREDAFYRDLFAQPQAFRVDPGPALSGPTIRILRLDP